MKKNNNVNPSLLVRTLISAPFINLSIQNITTITAHRSEKGISLHIVFHLIFKGVMIQAIQSHNSIPAIFDQKMFPIDRSVAHEYAAIALIKTSGADVQIAMIVRPTMNALIHNFIPSEDAQFTK